MYNTGAFLDTKFIRNFWSSFQNPENSGLQDRLLTFASKCVLPLIAIFLALFIALVSYMIYKRSEAGMTELLAENGASLLNVFESAVRMARQSDAGIKLHPFLDEIAKSSDIEFVAVTMPDGTIIAHSKLYLISERLLLDNKELSTQRMAKLAPEDKEKAVRAVVDGREVFVVYRNFIEGKQDWPEGVPKPVIFLGLEMSPFEITNEQNFYYVGMLSIVTMLVVLCGLIALSYAQRAAVFEKSKEDAEGEVHRLEREMRRQEKLAAVGTMAAGVAHEIRNPLGSLKGYATYFRQKFPEGSEDREAATVMVKEVDRLNRVITDLLGLSRPDDVKLKPVRLDFVIEHVCRLLRHSAAQNHVTVQTHSIMEMPEINGDIERLSQALLNICLNGIQSMPNGGNLDIEVIEEGKKICMIIRDSGCGISPENMNKIFDPYFTTKGGGTGLGLPMVHKIIQAHQGSIDVTSTVATTDRPGCTVFRIWLPILKHSSGDSAPKGDTA